MAADRDRPAAADYVIAALSPLLVMLMVGSLVFFLVETLYAGKYSFRLLYTMFFFVAGAVLVARIAIQYDAARASIYGLGLGLAVFLAMTSYVDYPAGSPLRSYAWAVNLGLMGLVWWAAHKLTWDCTHLDASREVSGRGLLAAAGLDDSSKIPVPGFKLKKGQGWFARYLEYRERRRARPHTPGVWVVYFALAALPLFGLGQSLIDPADADRRQTAFWLMVVYVGSGLGLLVTTSLIGLRKYLRQRRAKVPTAIVANWLGLGAVLTVAFLVLGAFLPRPHSEVAWFGIARVGAPEHKPSRVAAVRDGGEKGQGAKGTPTKDGENAGAVRKGEPSGGEKGARPESEGKGEGKNEEGANPDAASNNPHSGSTLEKVSGFLKWVAFALVLFAVLAAVAFFVLRFLAPFTGWAGRCLETIQEWWAKLFARKSPSHTAAERAEDLPVRTRVPFSAFTNPFPSGASRSPDELIEYTFAAVDAWAGDRGGPRGLAETPLEFAARLGQEFPALEEVGQKLASLYVRMAYARTNVPQSAVGVLEEVWERLEGG